MECLSQMWSIVPCLWECSNKHVAYISGLEDNLNSLRNAMNELSGLSQDVKNRVRAAEEQHMKRTNEVNGWIQRVEVVNDEVYQILEKGTQELENKCVGNCCPKNCRTSYKLSKKVVKMLPQVTGLIEKGKFVVIADKLPLPLVDELPMEGTVVGFESKFEEVWQSVQDKDSSIVGLVGTGGVGKTTLLKKLNNEFLKTNHGFDLVIWIVVPKPADLGRIQNTVQSKLNIPSYLWENKSINERAILIFNKLKEKKFVVLLDDLWERLDLSEVGIPIPQCGIDNMSRVVFTTRSEEICRSLDAPKIIKVGCLPPDQALDLFRSKVGEDVPNYHPEIRQLVKDVASECGGLPLALITIGRAMSGKTDAQHWKDAKRMLMMYPSTFPGMQGEIFSKLVFSYDNLPTTTLQKCFQYCSIFPEDHEILKEELIRLWIAEGIIDEYGNISDEFIQGRQIIKSLMQACLLEACEEERAVKMHDVIRDMALWLACERGEKKNKFLIVDGASSGGRGLLAVTQWRNAEKVSLWGRNVNVKTLAGLSYCSNIVTLIIRTTNLKGLPVQIFQSMNALVVLDLSDNAGLIEIPTKIGCLINLEYLNLVDTCVERLPEEVKQLKKLRLLLLNCTTLIPRGVISNLLLLQTFEQNFDINIEYEAVLRLRKMGKEMLGELEELEHIMDVSLVICKADSIQILLDSPKLQSCTRQLHLFNCESLPTVLDLSTEWISMEQLHLKHCYKSSAIKFGSLDNLRHVSIFSCSEIRNLSSLIHIPNLCTLDVSFCKSMEELIGEDGVEKMEESKINDNSDKSSSFLFSSLTSLTLWNLPKLRSICPHSALPFPSFQVLDVFDCPSLKKLPLDFNTAKTTPPEFKIVGDIEWWDNILQWDAQETKDAFTPKFQSQPMDINYEHVFGKVA